MAPNYGLRHVQIVELRPVQAALAVERIKSIP